VKTTKVYFPDKLLFLADIRKIKERIIVIYGGRAGAKSWCVAQGLVLSSIREPLRVLCTREIQDSIASSVHSLLQNTIHNMQCSSLFKITENKISNLYGSEFWFAGMRDAAKTRQLKSFEGADICWVEEADNVSRESWSILLPTIRKNNSKIIITLNPNDADGATYRDFIVHQKEDSLVVKINYDENEMLSDSIKKQIEYDKKFMPPDDFAHVWQGEPRLNSDSQIFKNKWEVQEFETRPQQSIQQGRYFYGVDWGFAQDPTTMIRCYIFDGFLYIDYEVGATGCDLDDTPTLFDKIPESRKWKIYADSARPESISYISKKGFNIHGVRKARAQRESTSSKGYVEDGIEYLKSFKKIIVHPRCKGTINEFMKYSYKIDRNTGEILPMIDDAYNHYIDAIRYSLSDYIHSNISILDVL
jgi:phage terminase large subunit